MVFIDWLGANVGKAVGVKVGVSVLVGAGVGVDVAVDVAVTAGESNGVGVAGDSAGPQAVIKSIDREIRVIDFKLHTVFIAGHEYRAHCLYRLFPRTVHVWLG